MAFARPRLFPASAAASSAEDGEFVRIGGGWFLFGARRERRWIEEFRIERRPVTNTQFAAFARATSARVPQHFGYPGFLDRKGDHPVVGITLVEALAYAAWRGADLPSEEEWERAARGVEGRVYPWGNAFDPGRCNTAASGRRDTCSVDAHPSGATPEGCRELCGNVWEWTRTEVARGLYVVKGGSWYDPPAVARADARFTARGNFSSSSLGFRCVRRSATLPPIRPPGGAPGLRQPVRQGENGEGASLLAFLRERAAEALGGAPEGIREIRAFDASAALREMATTFAPVSEAAPAPPPPAPPPAAEDAAQRRLALPAGWARWIAILLGANISFFLLRVLLG